MTQVKTLDPYVEFFARIWAVDLACPTCGVLQFLKDRRKVHMKSAPCRYAMWSPLIGRFRCSECTTTWILGVVAWSVPFASFKAPPSDHVPKPWHRARMRELMGPGGVLMDWRDRQRSRDPANLVVTEPCCCELDPAGMVLRDPTCPVHGRLRNAQRQRDDPHGTTRRFPRPKPPRKPMHRLQHPVTKRWLSKKDVAALAAGGVLVAPVPSPAEEKRR